jgi:hypothetical protein
MGTTAPGRSPQINELRAATGTTIAQGRDGLRVLSDHEIIQGRRLRFDQIERQLLSWLFGHTILQSVELRRLLAFSLVTPLIHQLQCRLTNGVFEV